MQPTILVIPLVYLLGGFTSESFNMVFLVFHFYSSCKCLSLYIKETMLSGTHYE